MSPAIIDPFYRELYHQVSAQIDQRIDQLARGGAQGTNASDTAEKYAKATAYIGALRDVIEMCQGIEKARYPDQPQD